MHLKRLLFQFLTILGAIYTGYVISVFIFLSSPIFESVVVFGPNKGALKIGLGWSLVPGVIYLQDVVLEIEDQNMRLKVVLPRVKTVISLKSVLKREILISQLITPLSKPVSAQIHLRTPTESKDYQIKVPDTLEPLLSRPWLVYIQGVHLAQVAQLSINQWQFSGKSQVRGAFRLLPGLECEIFPSTLSIESGAVLGLSKQIQGNLVVAFTQFSVPDVDGDEAFHYFNSRFDLSAKIDHLGLLDSLLNLKEAKFTTVDAGRFSASGEIKSGILLPKSKFEFNAKELGLAFAGGRVSAQGALSGEIVSLDKPVAKLKISLENLQFFSEQEKIEASLFARGPSLSGEIFSSDLDLSFGVREHKFDWKLASLEILSFKKLVKTFGKQIGLSVPLEANGKLSFRVLGGRSTVLNDHKNKSQKMGSLSLSLQRLRVEHPFIRLTGDNRVTVKADLFPINLMTDSLRLKNLEVLGHAPTGGFQLRGRQVKWKDGKLSSSLKLVISESGPLLRFLKEKEVVTALWEVLIPSAPLTISTDLIASSGRLNLNSIDVQYGTFAHATGRVSWYADQPKQPNHFDAYLLGSAGFLPFGITLLGSKIDAQLFPNQIWVKQAHFNFQAHERLAPVFP